MAKWGFNCIECTKYRMSIVVRGSLISSQQPIDFYERLCTIRQCVIACFISWDDVGPDSTSYPAVFR